MLWILPLLFFAAVVTLTAILHQVWSTSEVSEGCPICAPELPELALLEDLEEELGVLRPTTADRRRPSRGASFPHPAASASSAFPHPTPQGVSL